jgi:hydroxymethylbilane synthase
MNLLSTTSGTLVPTLQDFNQESKTFRVGTRKSKLAIKQTDIVVGGLLKSLPDHTYEVKARDTAAGDIDKVTPFKDMAVKNIWTHELEVLMLEGQLDFLVHSLKGRSTP